MKVICKGCCETLETTNPSFKHHFCRGIKEKGTRKMTKGYDAWEVLNVLVNRIKVVPDYTPTYDVVRQLLLSVSDVEWDYILEVQAEGFKQEKEKELDEK